MALRVKSSRGPKERVVLLLDLDCFYAQCECIRLGFEASTTSLALLQWNSVLAVTYPARSKYGIKRGDKWATIREKVQAQQKESGINHQDPDDTCHAIHVPLLLTSDVMPALSNAMSSSGSHVEKERPQPHSNPPGKDSSEQQQSTTSTAIHNPYLKRKRPVSSSPMKNCDHVRAALAPTSPPPDSTSVPPKKQKLMSLEEEYDSIFDLTHEQQLECRKRELWKRRLSNEGKASIERYRIASARIFQEVHGFIDKQKVVIERASIDEFFLDVTGAVNDLATTLWTNELIQAAKNESVQITAKGSPAKHNTINEDEMYWRGAAIALAIRRHIFETLGFTLTAGISTNKTLAKLVASNGKPNGQGICLPHQVPLILEQTPMHKCRNLGGKLGKKVQALLMKEQPSIQDPKSFSLDSVSRMLSLPMLRQSLGGETADWIFNLSAYGTDNEPVVPKQQHDNISLASTSTTKSLTAFKSLPNSRSGLGHSIQEATPWTRLLATDVAKRVQSDTNRNKRVPKTCTLQYTKLLPRGETITRSIRMPFPPQTDTQQLVDTLCEAAATALIKKEGHKIQLTRIGFCASDFVQQGNSIERFFSGICSQKTQNGSSNPSREIQESDTATLSMNASGDEESKEFSGSEAGPPKAFMSAKLVQPTNKPSPRKTAQLNDRKDDDMALAMKLQAQFDREDRAWERLGRSKKPHKKQRQSIKSFFSAK